MRRDRLHLFLDVISFVLFALGAGCILICVSVIWDISARPAGLPGCGTKVFAIPVYGFLAIVFWLAFLLSLYRRKA